MSADCVWRCLLTPLSSLPLVVLSSVFDWVVVALLFVLIGRISTNFALNVNSEFERVPTAQVQPLLSTVSRRRTLSPRLLLFTSFISFTLLSPSLLLFIRVSCPLPSCSPVPAPLSPFYPSSNPPPLPFTSHIRFSWQERVKGFQIGAVVVLLVCRYVFSSWVVDWQRKGGGGGCISRVAVHLPRFNPPLLLPRLWLVSSPL